MEAIVFAIVACPSLDRGQGTPIDTAVAFGRTNGKGVVIDITRLNGGGFGDMEQMDKGEQQESIENHWNGGWVCGLCGVEVVEEEPCAAWVAVE